MEPNIHQTSSFLSSTLHQRWYRVFSCLSGVSVYLFVYLFPCYKKTTPYNIRSCIESLFTKDGTRTRTALRPGDFKSPVSTIPPLWLEHDFKVKTSISQLTDFQSGCTQYGTHSVHATYVIPVTTKEPFHDESKRPLLQSVCIPRPLLMQFLCSRITSYTTTNCIKQIQSCAKKLSKSANGKCRFLGISNMEGS